MGCCHPRQPDPVTAIHVPFGHVPYAPSLPRVMGPQLHYQLEWWFYGGWATDAENSRMFSLILWSHRALESVGGMFYGIGVKSTASSHPETAFFTRTESLAAGQFPIPTATNWQTNVEAGSGNTAMAMHCKLTSGTLGLRGSTYQVDMNDHNENIQVSLKLTSYVGLVEEGPACMYPGMETIQFNMPAMTISEGSTITIAGVTTQLVTGNIWLDRQCLKMGIMNFFKPLYTGVWLAITMNDKTSYTIQFLWPKIEEAGRQWIVGKDVGYPPTMQTALEYPALLDWDGKTPVQGVNVLEEQEFDLNILTPNDPDNSPHWKSPKNEKGNTYCTAWNLKLKNKTYKMYTLVPSCEVYLDTYFFEGIATISDDNGTQVGYAVVEQMGYN